MAKTQLFAVHNLSQDKLHYAADLGGLACPSMAIIRNDIPYTEFGDITLIVNKQTVNPNRVSVFDADVYSKRFPTVYFKANKNAALRLQDRFEPFFEEIGNSFPLEAVLDAVKKEGAQNLVDEMKDYSAMKLAYLRHAGRNPRVPFKSPDMKHDLSKHPRVKAWFKRQPDLDFDFSDPRTLELGKIMQTIYETEAEEDARIQASKRAEYFDKDEDDLYEDLFARYLKAGMDDLAATPDGFIPKFHILQEMIKDHINLMSGDKVFDKKKFKQQQEKFFDKHDKDFKAWLFDAVKRVPVDPYFFHETAGGNRVKKDLTLDNLTRSLKGAIRDSEGFNYGAGNIRSKLAYKFSSISDVSDKAHRIVSSEVFDSEKQALRNEVDRLATELKPFYKYEQKYYTNSKAAENIGEFVTTGFLQDFSNVPDEIIEEIKNYASDLRDASTEYFEAKLQRSVELDEFVGAVVPKNASEDTFRILRTNNIPFKTYDPRNDASRLRAMKHFSEHAFGSIHHDLDRNQIIEQTVSPEPSL